MDLDDDARPEDFTGEELAAFVAAYKEITKIKRTYDRRSLEALVPEMQDRVRNAEYAAYFRVKVVASYTGPDSDAMKSSLHASDVFLGDAELIDKPLEAIGNLAAAYHASGLAPNEQAAGQMAEAFKTAVGKLARGRFGRGG